MKNKIIPVILLLIFSSLVFPQQKPFTIADLYKIKYVGKPVLSHSGKEIAFAVINYNLNKGETNSDIYIMKNDGTELKPIAGTIENETGPLWSADDSVIYYLIDRQLYSYNMKSGNTEKITDISTGISDPVLSPDGRLIAFTTDIFPGCGTDDACNKKLLKSSESKWLQMLLELLVVLVVQQIPKDLLLDMIQQ